MDVDGSYRYAAELAGKAGTAAVSMLQEASNFERIVEMS